jgi:hypothetical protein
MAVMDEFKEERAKVKEMCLRDKIDHFVYYHKVEIMLTVLVLFLVGTYVNSLLTNKDNALCIALIDCHETDFTGEGTSAYESALAEQLQLNTSKYAVALDNSYYLSSIYTDPDKSLYGSKYAAADETAYQLPEILWTRMATGQLDAFVAAENYINGWVMNDGFLDLREVMSPEQYEFYKDSFYWIDYDLLSNYELDFNEGAFVYDGNHRSPEGMKDPMPVGVYITPNESFQEHFRFIYASEVVYCLTYQGQPEDIAKQTYDGTKLALDYLDIISGRTSAN